MPLTQINVTSLKVLDKDQALDFYVGKLGLEVGNDVVQGPTRWLTVRIPGDPSIEIFLEEPGPPAQDEATAEQMRELIAKGGMGFTVAFRTDDCRKFYEEIKARGVSDEEITQPPTEHFYGTDMAVRDPFGNHLRIVQPGGWKGEGAGKGEGAASAS